MRLTELEPKFVRYEGNTTRPVERMIVAQGIWFLCPACFVANKGSIGTHWVDVSFAGRGVADWQGSHNDKGEPSRWGVNGTGFENLSLTPSIKLNGGCNWHGHITAGAVTP